MVIVTLRWTTRCHHCDHEYVEERDIEGPGVEYAAPSVPYRCEQCQERLQNDPHVWSRSFEVKDAMVIDQE
jgi:predicted SprT family Zn-dependent metalloprotease